MVVSCCCATLVKPVFRSLLVVIIWWCLPFSYLRWLSLHVYLVETCGIVACKIPESTSRKRTSLVISSSVLSLHRLRSRPRRVLIIQETDNYTGQRRRERYSLVLNLISCRPLIFVFVFLFKRNWKGV